MVNNALKTWNILERKTSKVKRMHTLSKIACKWRWNSKNYDGKYWNKAIRRIKNTRTNERGSFGWIGTLDWITKQIDSLNSKWNILIKSRLRLITQRNSKITRRI
jgi:hypothetical protein